MKAPSTRTIRIGIATLLTASLLSFEFASASGPKCAAIFSEQNSIAGAIHDLSAMRISLDHAKAKGTNSIEMTALASDYRKKEQALVEYLETTKIMTRQEFEEQVKLTIARLQGENQVDKEQENRKKDEEARRRKAQEELISKAVIDGTRAVMHRVEPGSFKMGKVGKQVDVTLTKPFEMQATQMTQIIWKTVVELAAQRFAGKYQLTAEPSYFKGDTRPVERVSFEDTQTWFKAVNELSAMGEPSLAKLIPGHKKGDVYRLPTEAEWEFVVRGRGQYNDAYHFGNDASQLGEYAWYSDNSGGQTHPVAQKKPLVIDGRDFYDMHGNVYEWVQDWAARDPSGGVDPQGPAEGKYRATRGGGYNYTAVFQRSDESNGELPESRSRHEIGFRIVRNVE